MDTSKQISNIQKTNQKLTMLTCYDATFAELLDNQIDLILVGDSYANVILGHDTTTNVTMHDMTRITQAVAQNAKNTLIIGDMPAHSYDTKQDALQNATKLIHAGAHAVKIENAPEIAQHITNNNIHVMGHIGLTPQTITDYKVQGKTQEQQEHLLNQATDLEKAGCFAIVLECIPRDLAKKITNILTIPTIGIGAGPDCDGQVLVLHDMLGLFTKFKPTFVKRYAHLANDVQKAVTQYVKEVKENTFPSDKESFH